MKLRTLGGALALYNRGIAATPRVNVTKDN